MSDLDNDFKSDGLDDWLSDGIDGKVRVEFVDGESRRRSAGTIFRRGQSEIWTARYTDENGRRVDRTTGFTSRSDAEAVLSRWVEEVRWRRVELESKKRRAPKEHIGDAERVISYLKRNGPSTERDIRLNAGGFQRQDELLARTLHALSEEHISDPSRGITKSVRRQSGVGGRPTFEYAIPSPGCRCRSCEGIAPSPNPKTIRELVETTRESRARNERLVVCRGGLIEIRDIDEDGRQQGGVYSVPVEEVRTLSGRLEWIRHLCEKSWITPTHILKFIEACEKSIGGAP